MSLREFIKADKTVTDFGAWSDKKMPKAGNKFPLTKARSFRVGTPGWRWRLLHISAGGQNYRLLVTYHPAKENFIALLGVELGTDTMVLGVLEYHSTHRGWHFHGCCKAADTSHAGRLRYPGMERVPKGDSFHRDKSFNIDDDSAYETVKKYFRLPTDHAPTPTQTTLKLVTT